MKQEKLLRRRHPRTRSIDRSRRGAAWYNGRFKASHSTRLKCSMEGGGQRRECLAPVKLPAAASCFRTVKLSKSFGGVLSRRRPLDGVVRRSSSQRGWVGAALRGRTQLGARRFFSSSCSVTLRPLRVGGRRLVGPAALLLLLDDAAAPRDRSARRRTRVGRLEVAGRALAGADAAVCGRRRRRCLR
jgi:hypothetical protein